MTTAEAADRPSDELMAQVVLRLSSAASLAWRHADAGGPSSPLHDLGLSIYLARGAAADLLVGELQVDEPEGTAGPQHDDQRSVVELLTDAESLLGSRTDLVFSGLPLEVCDLIREARAHGC